MPQDEHDWIPSDDEDEYPDDYYPDYDPDWVEQADAQPFEDESDDETLTDSDYEDDNDIIPLVGELNGWCSIATPFKPDEYD